jgi:cytochrome b subunit of formate dehydrogenase
MREKFIIKERNGKKYFFRFTLHQRLQHILLAALVIILVLTGMPLKFHQTFWAPYLYTMFGGIKVAPVVHKIAGTVLVILFIYHLFYLCIAFYKYHLKPLKQKKQASLGNIIKTLATFPMLPTPKDIKDFFTLLKYLFFISNKRPEGDEFTWKEKFDYWGPFWGIVIMGTSGIIMWQKELVTKILPGEIINFALIAHSDEALLAALFLFIWHFYNVHFSTSVFPMETAFLTGYLSEEMMVEEHYDYYKKVMQKNGLAKEMLAPDGTRAADAEETSPPPKEVSASDLPRV